MVELNTSTTVTTNNDSGNMDDGGLMPVHETERNLKGGHIGKGGEIIAGAKKEPEEALETHEVIEINKFTERKEWIEEKTKVS
jgi:hypothetical protein